MATINVSIRKTTRNGRDWFEVSAYDQAARDEVGATMGRSDDLEYALVDFTRRTIEVMGGAPRYEVGDLILHFA